MMRRVLACVGAALTAWGVSGCGSGARGELFRPEVIAGDQAVIYIFRDRGMGRPVRVVVDQDDVIELRPGEYAARVVRPGEHLVRVEGASSMVREVRLVSGDAAYLRVSTSQFGNHPSLSTLEEAAARDRIAGNSRTP